VNLPSDGICFGFSVETDLALAFTRSGTGSPLVVVEGDLGSEPEGPPLLEWVPRPGHPFQARLHVVDGGFVVWIDDVGAYLVRPDAPRIEVPAGASDIAREERLWGIPAALCLVRRGDVPLHAAAVEVEGRALLLAAPGRFGKTTLAAAFGSHGHRVLSEDLACLRPGDPPAILPGPAMLRVRRDVAERAAMPAARVVAEDEERIHLALDDAGDGDPVPVAGVVLLRWSGGDIRLDRMERGEALRELWPVSFNLPTDEDRARCFRDLTELVSSVPVRRLDRPLGFDVIDQVVELLASEGPAS
jgi:hypothetical protein